VGDERARLDEAKVRIRAAYAAKPQRLYELGAVARGCVEAEAFAQALGYADTRAMLLAELPEIPPETVLHAAAVAAECSAAEVEQYSFEKMWVVTRWVREAGLVRPPGGLAAWVVQTVDRDGEPAGGKPFAKCSVSELEAALAAVKKRGPGDPAKPPPPPPATQPASAWRYWPVLAVVAALVLAWWLFGHHSDDAGLSPEPQGVAPPHVDPIRSAGPPPVVEPVPQQMRPAHRAAPESASSAGTPPSTPPPVVQRPDVGPDLTQEQLDRILRNAGPITHPVE
jgi:hypothetical protein